MTKSEIPVDKWAELRKAFDPLSVGKLPQPLKRGDEDKGKCSNGSRYSADGYYCNGYHSRSIHLDYVGHAAVTDRLNSVDPEWSWEPMATDEDGLPKLDRANNLWIKLTVLGVTRIGVGDGKNAKECIGDALRNAAMRFGVALDLWSKDELESHIENPEMKNKKPTEPVKDEEQTTEQWARIGELARELGLDDVATEALQEKAGTFAKANKVIAALEAKKQERAVSEFMEAPTEARPEFPEAEADFAERQKKITLAQNAKIQTMFNARQIKGSDARHTWMSELLGREVTGTMTLTAAEASEVIKALEAEGEA